MLASLRIFFVFLVWCIPEHFHGVLGVVSHKSFEYVVFNLNSNGKNAAFLPLILPTGFLGFPVVSFSQGLGLMGYWVRFLIDSSEQLICLTGYIRGSLCLNILHDACALGYQALSFRLKTYQPFANNPHFPFLSLIFDSLKVRWYITTKEGLGDPGFSRI